MSENTDKTILLVIDMQDGMWVTPDVGEEFDLSMFDEAFKNALKNSASQSTERRKNAMIALAGDIQHFIGGVDKDTRIVWVKDTSCGDLIAPLSINEMRGDVSIEKSGFKSAHPQNTEFFDGLKSEGYTRCILMGAFAGECVRNTGKDLAATGWAVTVINDLIIDDARPGNQEAIGHAAYVMAQEGMTPIWLGDKAAKAQPIPVRGQPLPGTF